MATLLKELAAFVKPLTGQNIRLVAGTSWHYQPEQQLISVDRADLAWRPKQWLFAVLLHEVGHVLISRYTCFNNLQPAHVRQANAQWRPLLANVLEDIRVNNYISKRYPSAAGWINALYQTTAEPPLLRCQQFLNAVFYQHYQPQGLHSLDAEVRQAIAALNAPLAQLYQCFPGTNCPNAADVFMQQLWPVLSTPAKRQPITGQEIPVLQATWQALTLQLQHVEPVFTALLEQDTARFAALLAWDPENCRKIASLGEHSDARFWQLHAKNLLALEAAMAAYPAKLLAQQPAVTKACREQAQRLVLALLLQHQPAQIAAETAVTQQHVAFSQPLTHNHAPATQQQYQQRALAHQAASKHLRQQLIKLLPHAFLPQPHSHAAASGNRLQPGAIMQHIASGGADSCIWHKPRFKRQPAVAISLLIDCSGSMWPEKIAAALDGAIMLCQALAQSHIPFAINGFQDKLIAVKPLGTAMPDAAKLKLMALQYESSGTALQGNNQNGCNDDGPCLNEAANTLLQSSARHKLLIVIADGEVNGKHSTTADLTNEVARLTKIRNFSVIALGMGPGTKSITEHYPNSAAELAPEQLVEKLGELLVKAVG